MLRPYVAYPPSLGAHRQDGDPLDRLGGPLRIQIEGPERRDVVSPPFDPRRRRHPEAVHVEDAAAHAELRHLGHGRHAGVPHLFEAPYHVREPETASGVERQPRVSEGRRHPGSLRRGACRSHEQANPPREQRLEGFDPLAGDLDVRLLGTERLALRVQRGGVARERLQIGQPALGIGRRRRHHDEHVLRTLPRQRGRQGVEAIDQEGEGHQRVKVATPSSAAATSNASSSSGPLASLLPAPANRAAASAVASRTSAPNTSRTSAAGAGVRSDSRGSGPDTIAPTVSEPRARNSTPGGPSTSDTGASPRARRFTSASMNGTNAGATGSAVHAVSNRLPISRMPASRVNHGSPFTLARTVLSSPFPPPPSPIASRPWRRDTRMPS